MAGNKSSLENKRDTLIIQFLEEGYTLDHIKVIFNMQDQEIKQIIGKHGVRVIAK
jgi:hypothetical protein